MTDRQTHCLYLTAPSDSTDSDPPWCGLGFEFPAHCGDCEQYQPCWAPPDPCERQAWRQVTR
jgi:hypothetical protein